MHSVPVTQISAPVSVLTPSLAHRGYSTPSLYKKSDRFGISVPSNPVWLVVQVMNNRGGLALVSFNRVFHAGEK